MILSALLILLAGWCAYRLLTTPLKALLFIAKTAAIVALGFMVWASLFWLVLP